MTGRLAKQKSCTVKFIGDDAVENIVILAEKKSGRKKEDIKYELFKADDVQPEFSGDAYKPSTVLCADEPDDEIQQQLPVEIGTPKSRKITSKGHKLHRKALLNNGTSSPKTPSRQKNLKTPSSSKSYNNEDSGKRSLRSRFKQLDLDESTADSDPENSENESWDDDSESGDASDENLLNNIEKTPKTKKKVKNMVAFAEDYFAAQKQKKSVTSNHTMSKVDLPQTNIKDLQKICKTTQEYHKKEKMSLNKQHKAMFKKWTFLLQEGFSILLYGIGSKIGILQDFFTSTLEDEMYIVLNGFFPSLNIKQVLNSITEELIDHDGAFPSIFEHANFIKEHFDSGSEKLYLVVHNIDGPALRGMKTQSTLSYLAASRNIHFIASVDHINCSLIWDQVMLSHFKWVWHDVTTYEPYILETSYENSLLRNQSSHLILSSLIHVFQSLTPNGRGVFLILAKHQQSKKDTASFSGITFQDWYQECRELFLVNSELTMNAQLSEFKNHKLLSSRKSVDGVECWYIPVDDNALSQFLERKAEL